MKKSNLTKTLIALFIITSCINLYIYIYRDDFNFVKQSAYAELYPINKTINIKSFRVLHDSFLNIQLNNRLEKPVNWHIRRDTLKSYSLSSIDPVINLKEGISDYIIKSDLFKDSLLIRAEYRPGSYYTKHGYKYGSAITIYKTDLPNADISHLKKWQNNPITISNEDKKALKKILKDSIQIKATDNSFTRAQKIGKFLCTRITASKGVASDKTVALPVFDQYKAALKGNKIHCGIYANIFCLFATEAGIINRMVELRHRYGTFNGNIHVFNEYFADEENKWTAIDIMLNNINYTDAGGQLMNAVQVKNSTRDNNSINVLQSAFINDSVTSRPFSQLNAEFFNYYNIDKDLYYYYNTDTKRVYSFKEKLKRFFFKNPWFEIYSDVSIIDNKPFYIKQLFIIIEIILFILLLLNIFIKKLNRTK